MAETTSGRAIDRKMLPMKVHYFIRFAGTGPLIPFLSVIARQKGVSEQVVGVIWMVLPFSSLVTKTFVGALADCLRAHRVIFLSGVALMLAALSGLYWVPDVPTHCSNTTLLPQPVADAVTSHDSLTFHDSLTSQDVVGIERREPELAQEDRRWDKEEVEHLSAGVLMTRHEFWMLFICLLLQYCGHVTVITMQETVCFQMLGEARHRYGEQRLWGTVGWGVSAMASGALVDWYSKGSQQKDYLPAHLMTVVFLLVDLVVVARLRYRVPEKKMSPKALHGALWRPHILLVLVTLLVIGNTCGVLWTFHLLLVEDVARLWDPHFPHLRLLQGLTQGVQCFLAEVPFFFLAGRIVKKIGHVNSLLISLVGFAVRLSLYAVITNPWWFLPVDLLHGISFGIAYPTFTAYASLVAPKGAEATTQAIFGAAFFGGSGLGGLIGGWLFQGMGGRRTFLAVAIFNGIYALAFISLHNLISRLCPGSPQHEVDNEEASEGGVRQEEGEEEDEEKEEMKMEEVRLVDRVEKQPRIVPGGRVQTT